jgi:hypothetical protein
MEEQAAQARGKRGQNQAAQGSPHPAEAAREQREKTASQVAGRLRPIRQQLPQPVELYFIPIAA